MWVHAHMYGWWETLNIFLWEWFSIKFWNILNVGAGKDLVKPSAILLLDAIWFNLIVPNSTWSLIWWNLISICLDLLSKPGFSANDRAPVLSQKNWAGHQCILFISRFFNNFWIHMHSWAASDIETYSALHVLVATMSCFLVFQEMGELAWARKKQ